MTSWRRHVPSLVLTTVTFVLIIAHAGEKTNRLTIDEVTVALLALGTVPWLDRFLHSLKAGGVELHFHSLEINEQVLLFLEAIVRKETWTFYRPREGSEEELGAAFRIMADRLHHEHFEKLCEKIKEWSTSPNENLRYFAAEFVGYYKIHDLKKIIKKPKNLKGHLKPWQLNYIWALSRFDQNETYETLQDFLMQTDDPPNQKWVIEAYEQMIDSSQIDLDTVIRYLEVFIPQTRSSTVRIQAINLKAVAELAREASSAKQGQVLEEPIA